MNGAYCTVEMYSAYCTLEIILCLLHLKEPCAYCTSKNIVHIAPKKIICAYGTSNSVVPIAPQTALCLLHLKTCCLQLCRLLLLLHLQQKLFFLQGHWRRRGRLRWQRGQNRRGACRQCWPRKELGSPSRRQRRQLSCR